MPIQPLIQDDYKKKLEEYLMGKYGGIPTEPTLMPFEPSILTGDLTAGSSAQPLLSPQPQIQLAMAKMPSIEDVAPGAVSPTQPPLIEPLAKPPAKIVQPGVADVEPKKGMDSSMLDYMRKQEEDLSAYDERIKKAREAGPNLLQVLGMGFSGVGEAMTGRPYLQSTLKQIQGNLEQRVRNIEAEKEQAQEKDTRNPDSFISQKYRELAAKYMNKKPDELAGMSAYQIARVLPTIKSMYEADLAAEEKAANRAYREKMLESKQTEEEKLTAREASKKRINQPKEKALLTNAEANFDRMIKEAEEIKNHPGLGLATGITKYTSIVPGTPAADAQSRINTLKSKTGFSVLQDMRANSPTGGALGQVSDRENQMLQENISSLDQSQSTQAFRDSLDRVIEYAKGAKARLRGNYNEYYADTDPELKKQAPQSQGGVADADRQAALDWIQKNPTDPRVPAIKAKLGVQ